MAAEDTDNLRRAVSAMLKPHKVFLHGRSWAAAAEAVPRLSGRRWAQVPATRTGLGGQAGNLPVATHLVG
ncbi:hypothetical protein SAMN05216188_10635 [Lentzea xinjiangensis]|uniref:Uncharacterized protein n=1 Tax=Lentzea xinjiangensis TaxID=402600 RepID=A0A1H9JKI1_9PSEU|nr:hypothetical protein [Lentzea xinjiangensis]SEQ87404.1 hypothetical protein SAMN05216188_10635 [Lentzea xinjiangensis]